VKPLVSHGSQDGGDSAVPETGHRVDRWDCLKTSTPHFTCFGWVGLLGVSRRASGGERGLLEPDPVSRTRVRSIHSLGLDRARSRSAQVVMPTGGPVDRPNRRNRRRRSHKPALRGAPPVAIEGRTAEVTAPAGFRCSSSRG